jgi:hypothetical protein
MLLRSIPQEFYGDSTRWWIGTVIDASPPAGLEGRIRVRIRGVQDGNVNNVPQADLPWAQVMIPGDQPGVSGLGTSCRIQPGAQVIGIFVDGISSQIPIVFGSFAKIEYPTSVQAAGRDDPSTNFFAYDLIQQRVQGVMPALEQDLPDNLDARQARRSTTIKFFLDNGYTVNQAAGITGVLDDLSELKPDYLSENLQGMALWSSNSFRQQQLQRFSGTIDGDFKPDSLTIQLLFIHHELNTTKANCHSKLIRSKSIVDPNFPSSIRGTGTCSTFALHFLDREVRERVVITNAQILAQDAYNVAIKDT